MSLRRLISEAHTPGSPCVLEGFNRILGIVKTKDKIHYHSVRGYFKLIKEVKVTAVMEPCAKGKRDFECP